MTKTKMINISDAILVVFNNGITIRPSIKCTGEKRMMRVKFSDAIQVKSIDIKLVWY